jgi:hypothetical protein
LLVPIILFLLGLPSKGPDASERAARIDVSRELSEEVAGSVGMIMLGSTALDKAVVVAALQEQGGNVIDLPRFRMLEDFAKDDFSRSEEGWKNKIVRVKGQFKPDPGSDRFFGLVRFRIQCCAADAVPLQVLIRSKESITGFKKNDWINVTGRVDFRKMDNNTWVTFLTVPGPRGVTLTDPDSNPYDR